MQNCPNHILISYIVQSVFCLVFKLFLLCQLFCKELTWLFSYSKSNCRNCQKVIILQKLSESGYIADTVRKWLNCRNCRKVVKLSSWSRLVKFITIRCFGQKICGLHSESFLILSGFFTVIYIYLLIW